MPRAQLQFDSELLLQQAVANLLGRMPLVTSVQITHGSLEFGKDVVFRSTGPVGESITCACVIKNSPVSAAAGASGSIRTVVDQITQAFDTPFVDLAAEHARVHKVYLVSPYEISQQAAASVLGRLRGREGQVHFLTGADLFRVFQQFWPDYFAAERSEVERLASALSESSGAGKALLSLAGEHDPNTARNGTPEVYLQPPLERELRLYSVVLESAKLFSDSMIEGRITKAQIVAVQRHLLSHIAFLRVFTRWQLRGVFAADQLAEVERDVNSLCDEIKSGFVESIRVRKGTKRSAYSQLASSADVVFIEEALRSVEKVSVRAAVSIQKPWALLRDRFEADELWAKSVSRDSETVLESTKFHEACALDDCARTAPEVGILCQVSRITFRFEPGVHRRVRSSLQIVGGPGTGKTSFCTRNALIDAERAASRPGAEARPIYTPLHQLKQLKGRTFEELFATSASIASQSEISPADIEIQRTRLYLDGLDEVTDESARGELLSLLSPASVAEDDKQIVITMRDYIIEPRLSWMPRLSLGGLSDRDLRTLATQWLDGDLERTDEFFTQLKALPALKHLVATPLLAVVTVLIFKRTNHLPRDRVRLYAAFLSLLCGGWDLAKGILRRSEFDVSTKIHVLSSLAASVHIARHRDFSPLQLQQAAATVLSRRQDDVHARFAAEVVRDGIVTQTGSRLHFCHLSFQEYLAAKEKIGDPGFGRADPLIKKYVNGDDWWREVLAFYIGLAENPVRTWNWLRTYLPTRGTNERTDVLYDAFNSAFPDFLT